MLRIRVDGPKGPSEVHHLDADLVVVGRGSECDLSLTDPALSRVHAELEKDGETWIVRDRDSANGTFVNGLRITDALAVGANDQVRLGDTVLSLLLEGGAATAARSGQATTVRQAEASAQAPLLLGGSAVMERLRQDIDRVAPLALTVLVRGETGTGKELVARALHERSPRHGGPLVVVNCPALPGALLESELFGVEKGVATGVDPRTGLLAMAEGGTVFLDEIGDLDPVAQAKLLRFLETKTIEPVGGRKPLQVDARVVAATHQDLEAAVEDGRFRRDLFHRLNGVTLEAPALSERREDIPELVRHFLSMASGREMEVEEAAMARLEAAAWPGNVRELKQAVERATAFGDGRALRAADLPETLQADAPRAQGCAELYDDLLDGKASFWQDVRDPFLKRELSKDEVRSLIAKAHAEHGASYSEAARAFGLEGEEKRFLNFVNRHGLGVDD